MLYLVDVCFDCAFWVLCLDVQGLVGVGYRCAVGEARGLAKGHREGFLAGVHQLIGLEFLEVSGLIGNIMTDEKAYVVCDVCLDGISRSAPTSDG